MGYTKDVIKGFSWIGAFRIATRSMSFLRTIVIARILSPSQVGVFGIATIVLSLVEVLTETGINIFLIQKKDQIDSYISTAWITSIVRGLVIASVIFFTAPFITTFYRIPDFLSVLQLTALVPLLRGFINPSVVKFTKDLTFHKEFFYRTGIFLVETVVSLLLVFFYPHPISLIWGMVFGAMYEVVISFYIARPLPVFQFEPERLREVLNRGKWLTISGIFNYLHQNGDDLVVGKLLNIYSLGLYQMAYKISLLPMTEGTDVISRVVFPVFTKMSSDIPRLKKAYIKSVLLTLVIVVPMGGVFFLFPQPIIAILLGERWLEAADVLRVLAFFGVIRAITFSVVAPMYALEKQEYVTHISLISFLGMAVTIIPFVTIWGIVGAAYSTLFGSLIALPLALYYIYKIFVHK